MTVAGLRILVVEDEPVIALALEDLLLDGGAEPRFAATIAQAEHALGDGAPDAAILDLNVHGEKTYPLGERLRAQGVPFIFATGYGATGHPPEFADAPTITKPYSLAEIVRAMAEARSSNGSGTPRQADFPA